MAQIMILLSSGRSDRSLEYMELSQLFIISRQESSGSRMRSRLLKMKLRLVDLRLPESSQ